MRILKTNKLYVARLGIGLFPPRYDKETSFGHIWLYWTRQENDYHYPFRGYYPVEEQIPPEYSDYRKWPRFFARQCVQGRYRVDIAAMLIMNTLRDKVLIKEWSITRNQLVRLQKRCFIPKNQTFKLESYYSWNKRQPNWHNCSSWVINVVNHVMNEENFLVCSSPKRLGIVEEEIWKN